MSLSNTATRYGSVAKVFHWLTAALILAIIPLGIVANELPFATSEELARKALLFSLHKTLGVAVFFVALARIGWALGQVKPGALHPDRRAETLLAEVVHWLLYGSLVIAPLTGWVHHAATTGFAPIWWPFGQSLPFVPKDEGLAHLFGALHWWLTKVMAAAVFLHIAGALKHALIDRDATLGRMWFGGGDGPAAAPHRRAVTAPLVALAIFATISALAVTTSGGAHRETPLTADLAAVASDWAVTEGSIAITVQQFGTAVAGEFSDWTAAISFDPDAAGPALGQVEVTINIASLALGSVTDQAMGPDFFDTARFPTASFAGPILDTADGLIVDGTLTLKGAVVPVTLPFTLILEGETATATGAVSVIRHDFAIGDADEGTLGGEVVISVALKATRA